MNVAQTILEQIGGRSFRVFTGAKNFVGGDDFLQFDLPRGSTKNKCTKVRITLNGNDLYDVVFYKWNARKLELTTIKQIDDVYCDMLISIFEEETGLYVGF